MPTLRFAPPYAAVDAFASQLRELGHTVLAPASVAEHFGLPLAQLQALQPFWSDLPADAYLRDGGRYRFRRHASLVAQLGDSPSLTLAPHRAHWQPLDYNALHGGIERWFEPVHPALLNSATWQRLLLGLTQVANDLHPHRGPWFLEAHQFRIDTTDGIGRPTPEGAHRDGVDLVAVFMLARHNIKGGESRVFEAEGPHGQRFTLSEPWSLLLLDDVRVIHESTPIQPLDSTQPGHRDTLVVTLRREGFLGP
ncbi:2OG-Fe dioxygenase family protein [Roseateles sp. BYS180W]|uniref:2OG-Fe dioxygenase family protein n=1 Tax=Roseateles rivi TaxID=3299028 RepID=A0ABW7FZ22_9BURK